MWFSPLIQGGAIGEPPAQTINRIPEPQADLPRSVKGGSDVWDRPQAGVVLDSDWFPSSSTPTIHEISLLEETSATDSQEGTVSGGSTVYDESVIETTTTDAVESSVLSYADSINETSPATEVQEVSSSIEVVAAEIATPDDVSDAIVLDVPGVTETTSASDDQNSVQLFSSGINESSVTADDQSAVSVSASSITESATTDDPQSSNLSSVNAITEPTTVLDDQSAASSFALSISETSISSDTSDATIQAPAQIYNESLVETVTIIDEQSVLIHFASSLSEDSTITDSQTAIASFSSIGLESVSIDDATSSSSVMELQISNSVQLDDISSIANIIGLDLAEDSSTSEEVVDFTTLSLTVEDQTALDDAVELLGPILELAIQEFASSAEALGVSAVAESSAVELIESSDRNNVTIIGPSGLHGSITTSQTRRNVNTVMSRRIRVKVTK